MGPWTQVRNFVDSWTSEVLTISDNSVTEITPMENQVYIRIVPLVSGNFRYNFTSSVTDSNSEPFTSTSPISLNTSTSVFVKRDATTGSGNIVVYKGAKLP